MKIMAFGWIAGVLLMGLACTSGLKRSDVDLIFFNGALWTVSPDLPWAEAIAITGDTIIAVGSNKVVKKLGGPETELIDLEGAFVLPGFIDSHTHFLNGGFSLSSVQLNEAKSREEFVDKIRSKADSLGKGIWVLNGDWDHQKFNPPELPRKDWIDAATPDNPVCVNRHDGHMVLVNSLVLKMTGITRETESPEGGEIVKDPVTGEPTGILKDAAMDLVYRFIPSTSLEERVQGAEAALKYAAEAGVTTIHDMNFEDSVEALRRIEEEGDLSARIYGYIPISRAELMPEVMSSIPPDQSYLVFGGLKGFVDGSLGSATALFFDPYTDNPQMSGLLAPDMFPEGEMERRIQSADENGLQVAIHAIGDRANHLILDIFERVIKKNGERDRRWRIEHAQHLLPDDMDRFAELGIVASMQPYHAIDDGRWAEIKIGSNRIPFTYAFFSLLQKNAILAFGSDWTVAPMDPLLGIYAAVTRQTLDGLHPEGWIPEQKISLEEAIKAYTLNGAFLEFAEDKKGSLEKGKFADIVVLNQNLFDIPPEEIPETQVQMTIVGGKIVYSKPMSK